MLRQLNADAKRRLPVGFLGAMRTQGGDISTTQELV